MNVIRFHESIVSTVENGNSVIHNELESWANAIVIWKLAVTYASLSLSQMHIPCRRV